jgi:adenosylmethionine-8-amino-7-oxononanoate aminotransferase
MAFAATLTTKKVFSAFYAPYGKRKTFYHGHTFTANPVACSVALASLKIFEKEKTLKNAAEISSLLKKGLQKFKKLPHAGDVRCIGTVGAIELVKDKKTKKPFAFDDRVGYSIYKEGLKNNLILRPMGGVVYLCLPLCVTEPQLRSILSKFYGILSKMKYPS